MAKKSRTSNKKSNDKQKKLLALVLIILFIGLGVFLVVSSFAAKGGKSKPGSGTITLVDSPYAIKVNPLQATFGTSGATVVLSVTDKSGNALSSLPEEMAYVNLCTNSSGQTTWNGDYFNGPTATVTLTNPAVANSSCVAKLQVYRNFAWADTALANFTIIP